MYSIKYNDKYEEVIKYSRFISLIYKVYSKDEVNFYINKIKEDYKGATHYTYAYVIDNDIKASDDGEPSKTAGAPILNQITSNNLNYVLIIVIRYFGGVKFGVGPLTRTYAKVAREVIKKDNIIELIKGKQIKITFNYDSVKDIDYILKNSDIISKDFSDNITYIVNIDDNTYNNLTKYNIEILKDIYITKKEDN